MSGLTIAPGFEVPVGGGFRNALGALRSKGFVEKGDPVRITVDGIEALGPYDSLPTGKALVA